MRENNNELMNKLHQFIIDYKSVHDGNSPSIREMSRHLGIDSTSQVRVMLKDLQIAGRITRGSEARMIGVPGYRWLRVVREEVTE